MLKHVQHDDVLKEIPILVIPAQAGIQMSYPLDTSLRWGHTSDKWNLRTLLFFHHILQLLDCLLFQVILRHIWIADDGGLNA